MLLLGIDTTPFNCPQQHAAIALALKPLNDMTNVKDCYDMIRPKYGFGISHESNLLIGDDW
jgi:hypothetical protein